MLRGNNQVRIIGGKWRGRKLKFPEVAGLRPTHNRVRECLFNWLVSDINGSTCLDLFAGSGALGFEALSRGAKNVFFVDKNKKVISSLRENKKSFAAKGAHIIQGDFLDKHFSLAHRFDIVFLDPPFQQIILQQALNWLIEKAVLFPGSLIYFEQSLGDGQIELPRHYQLLKSKKTATLQYSLAQYLRGT